jgi:hypothetical protein
MDELLKTLSGYGITGVLLAIVIYDVFYLQRKVISIVENNSKAMEAVTSSVNMLKDVVNRCQDLHSVK